MITSFIFQSPSAFPLDAIRGYLDQVATASRDKWDDAVYVLADDQSTLRRALEARAENQVGFSRTVTLVRLYESRIDFSLQSCDVETARLFAVWLRSSFPLVVRDDSFVDISALCDEELTYLFGERRRRRLLPVGFFSELKHGRSDGPSLKASTREAGSVGEKRIASYLRQAPVLLHALGPVTDVLTPKGDYICAPNIHTDGVYAWPEDLAYYLERYHVTLPSEFIDHITAMNWTPPAEIDTAAVELG